MWSFLLEADEYRLSWFLDMCIIVVSSLEEMVHAFYFKGFTLQYDNGTNLDCFHIEPSILTKHGNSLNSLDMPIFSACFAIPCPSVLSKHSIANIGSTCVIVRSGFDRNISNRMVIQTYGLVPWTWYSSFRNVYQGFFPRGCGVPSQIARHFVIACPFQEVISIRDFERTRWNY